MADMTHLDLTTTHAYIRRRTSRLSFGIGVAAMIAGSMALSGCSTTTSDDVIRLEKAQG